MCREHFEDLLPTISWCNCKMTWIPRFVVHERMARHHPTCVIIVQLLTKRNRYCFKAKIPSTWNPDRTLKVYEKGHRIFTYSIPAPWNEWKKEAKNFNVPFDNQFLRIYFRRSKFWKQNNKMSIKVRRNWGQGKSLIQILSRWNSWNGAGINSLHLNIVLLL